MIINNTITKTNPLVLHAYGASHVGKEWDYLCDAIIGYDVEIPSDVTVMSFFFGNKNFALKQQLTSDNIPFIDAAENMDIPVWQDRNKIKLINDSIISVKTKYVLVLDGIDTLLSKDAVNISKKFEGMDCKILYNACVYTHPLGMDGDINSCAEAGVGVFNNLNTGAFIGETQFVKKFYTDLMEIYDDINMPVPHTDGIRVGLKWKSYPEIKVDYNCEIFQTLLGVEYTFENNILTVKN